MLKFPGVLEPDGFPRPGSVPHILYLWVCNNLRIVLRESHEVELEGPTLENIANAEYAFTAPSPVWWHGLCFWTRRYRVPVLKMWFEPNYEDGLFHIHVRLKDVKLRKQLDFWAESFDVVLHYVGWVEEVPPPAGA